MSNMSYCRFQNTYQDLLDCMEALEECGDLQKFIEERNSDERPYVEKLIRLCAEISADFLSELEA
jgi:hypothetical protein